MTENEALIAEAVQDDYARWRQTAIENEALIAEAARLIASPEYRTELASLRERVLALADEWDRKRGLIPAINNWGALDALANCAAQLRALLSRREASMTDGDDRIPSIEEMHGILKAEAQPTVVSHETPADEPQANLWNADESLAAAREFRIAVERSCDETLDEQKHQIRELQTELAEARAIGTACLREREQILAEGFRCGVETAAERLGLMIGKGHTTAFDQHLGEAERQVRALLDDAEGEPAPVPDKSLYAALSRAEALLRENEALAANQCIGPMLLGEGGNPYCRRIAALETENARLRKHVNPAGSDWLP